MSPAAAYLARLRGRGAIVQRGALSLALRHLAPTPHPSPPDVSASTLDAFPWHSLLPSDLSRLRDGLLRSKAPATAKRVLSAVRGVARECWRAGLLDADRLARLCDVAPIRYRREPRGRALSLDEVGRLIDAADGVRDQALVSLMAFGGPRLAEVAALRRCDVAVAGAGATVRFRGKGDKDRTVVLRGRAAEVVITWARAIGHPTDVTPVFGSAEQIRHTLDRLSSRAGVARLTPHDLRRTYATLAFAAGADLLTVQATMGHTSPETTMLYDRRGEDAKRKLAEQLDTYRGRGDA